MRQFKKSESGVLTIQFMMALILIMFFIVSFLGLSLTLTYASLTQYLTYSAARRQFLAGTGAEKYDEVKGVLPGGWFEISDPSFGFNHGGSRDSYRNQEDNHAGARHLFYGARVTFKSNIAKFKMPALTGATDLGLNTTIGSYLGKEVSGQDCQNFFQTVVNRNSAQMISREYREMSTMPGFSGNLEFKSDNGCE